MKRYGDNTVINVVNPTGLSLACDCSFAYTVKLPYVTEDTIKVMKDGVFFTVVRSKLPSEQLVSESKLWSNVEYGTEQPEQQDYHSYYIKFEGDSLLNQNWYKKMFRSDDSLHGNWIPYGFTREDSSGKVYAYTVPTVNYSDQEVLMYNFNLKKGDSINGGGDYYYPVDSVGLLPFGNKFVKVIYLAGWIKIIEGIGNTGGILWGFSKMLLVGEYHYLQCYVENDSLLWHNPDYASCYVHHLPMGIHNSKPATAALEITRDPGGISLVFPGEPAPYKLSIYDMNGKLLFRGSYTATRVSLSELNLPPGVYMVAVIANKKQFVGKVVLQKSALVGRPAHVKPKYFSASNGNSKK